MKGAGRLPSRCGRPAVARAALLLIVVASGVSSCRGGENGTAAEAPSAAAPAATIEPLEDFRSFATDVRSQEGPLQADALAQGLRTLAGALGTAGLAPPELLVDLRVAAEHVLLNPDSPEVTAAVRTALASAAAALPETGRAPAQQAADAIKVDVPLTEQGPAVRAVFARIADGMPASAGSDG